MITAEDVGAYKPAGNHFRALEATLADLCIPREQLLQVAQSLFHDHVPARRHGLASVFDQPQARPPGVGGDAGARRGVRLPAEFPSMAAFAEAVRDTVAG